MKFPKGARQSTNIEDRRKFDPTKIPRPPKANVSQARRKVVLDKMSKSDMNLKQATGSLRKAFRTRLRKNYDEPPRDRSDKER